LTLRERAFRLSEKLAPVVVGILLGTAVVAPTVVRQDWLALALAIIATGTVVILVRDLRKLLLIVLIADLPLGLDIVLGQRPDHIGGPSGLFVSLMTITFVAAVVYFVIEMRRSQPLALYLHPTIALPAFVYLLATAVSAFQATEIWFSIAQVFLEAQFLLLFLVMVNLIRTWSDVRTVFTTVAALLLLESLLMIAQYYGGFEFSAFGIYTQASASEVESAAARVSGTFSAPNLAATFLAASISMTLAGYLTNGRLVHRGLALFSFFAGIVALVMTQSRGGWIGTAIALSLLLVLALRRRSSAKVSLALLVGLVILAIGFSGVIAERFAVEDTGSAVSRIYHSRLALNIIRDHLVTGVGANNQRYFLEDTNYRPPELAEARATAIHNTYLAIWVELGLVGFLAYLWLIAAGGWRAVFAYIRAKDEYTAIAMAGLIAALVAYAIQVLTEPLRPRRLQVLWLILAFIAATSRVVVASEQLEDPLLQPERHVGGRVSPPADKSNR
jgi:O-antigen ligase